MKPVLTQVISIIKYRQAFGLPMRVYRSGTALDFHEIPLKQYAIFKSNASDYDANKTRAQAVFLTRLATPSYNPKNTTLYTTVLTKVFLKNGIAAT